MAKLEITLEKCEENHCYKCSLEPECAKLQTLPLCEILSRCTKIEISDREYIKEVKMV